MPPAKALITALIEEKSKLGDKAVGAAVAVAGKATTIDKQLGSRLTICVAFRLLVRASIVQLETSSPQCDSVVLRKSMHAVQYHSIDQSFDRTGRGYFLPALLDRANRQVVCYTLQTKPSCIAKPATGTEWLKNARKRRQSRLG